MLRVIMEFLVTWKNQSIEYATCKDELYYTSDSLNVPYIFSSNVTHHKRKICTSLYHDEPKVWLYLYSCIVLSNA
jgi:hypothetical protein